jgi:hypothetical protein
MRKADSVYVLLCAFKMFKMIEGSTDCEILADIHRQICEVHGENAMSDGMMS